MSFHLLHIHIYMFSYDAHINVEIVQSLSAAKYITKYTHKGPDRATVQLQQWNEVSEYRDSRYIAGSEAAWRLLEFPIHHQDPAVMSLQVHLPGQHMVYFNTNVPIETIAARARTEQTMLTAFFNLNQLDESAHQFTYQELPQHFVWDRKKNMWNRRVRGGTIGRMYFVSPTAGERFYLRTLLTTVKGPISWEDLRSFDGILYPSFQAACVARGLLEDDGEWRQCLADASLTHLGESLRHLFVLILTQCFPSQPHLLWEEFCDSLCDDLARRLLSFSSQSGPIPPNDIFDYGLFLIDEELRQHNTSLASFCTMPQLQCQWSQCQSNRFIQEQLAFDPTHESEVEQQMLPFLNSEQRVAFDNIWSSTSTEDGHSFFLHGPGSTGKTFLYSTVCHKARANTFIVLCVASCAIASLLLPGGHTAHSTFSIPVHGLTEDSTCQIDKKSERAEMLRNVRLIIWDEAVAQHRFAFESVF